MVESLEAHKKRGRRRAQTKILIADTYVEVVDFEELEEVHAHELEPNAEVLSKDHIVVEVNHIHDVLRVVFFQKLQDFKFHARLVVVLLLILDDLDGHIDAILVVETFDCRTERAFAKEALDLEAIADVIVGDDLIIARFIIVAIVVLLLWAALGLLCSRRTYEINLRVVKDLLLLILCQLVGEVDQHLLGCHRELWDLCLGFWRRLRLKRESGSDDVHPRF